MKEIDHILVSTSWRIVKFFATDHRLVVSLKPHVKSTKPPRCDPTVFHLKNKLKDLTYAQGYAVVVSTHSSHHLTNILVR